MKLQYIQVSSMYLKYDIVTENIIAYVHTSALFTETK